VDRNQSNGSVMANKNKYEKYLIPGLMSLAIAIMSIVSTFALTSFSNLNDTLIDMRLDINGTITKQAINADMLKIHSAGIGNLGLDISDIKVSIAKQCERIRHVSPGSDGC